MKRACRDMPNSEQPPDRIEGIERAPRRRQYENIPLPLIRDARLSYRALGVLTRLLSNADGFRMNSADLARERKEGRDAVRAALSELEDAGYIVRAKRQNTRGQWSTVMIVSEEPPGRPEPHSAVFQASVFPASVVQASENQALKSSSTNEHYQKDTTTTPANPLLWDYLPQLSHEQQVVVTEKLKALDPKQRQDVLDELAGAIRTKAIKGPWPQWLHGVIQKTAKCDFQPNLALAIQRDRKQRIEAEQTAAKRRADAVERAARNSDPATRARSKAILEAARALIHS
jgi:hypothetical protein